MKDGLCAKDVEDSVGVGSDRLRAGSEEVTDTCRCGVENGLQARGRDIGGESGSACRTGGLFWSRSWLQLMWMLRAVVGRTRDPSHEVHAMNDDIDLCTKACVQTDGLLNSCPSTLAFLFPSVIHP